MPRFHDWGLLQFQKPLIAAATNKLKEAAKKKNSDERFVVGAGAMSIPNAHNTVSDT